MDLIWLAIGATLFGLALGMLRLVNGLGASRTEDES